MHKYPKVIQNKICNNCKVYLEGSKYYDTKPKADLALDRQHGHSALNKKSCQVVPVKDA